MPAAKQYKSKVQLTAAGFADLQAELTELKDIKLPQVINRVAEARAHGDLSENAEYSNAKEEQQFVESRISEIEDILNTAQIVKATSSHTSIGIGSTVKVIIKGKGQKAFTYHVVGEFEADPTDGKISADSPLGRALLNKKEGDEVKVKAPAGEIIYLIKDIE